MRVREYDHMASMWFLLSLKEDFLETECRLAYPKDGVALRTAEHSAPSNSGREAEATRLGPTEWRPRDAGSISGPSPFRLPLGWHLLILIRWCYGMVETISHGGTNHD
jgi:hypothetical protein